MLESKLIHLGLHAILLLATTAFAQPKTSRPITDPNRLANDCLRELQNALVVVAPLAGGRIAMPESDLTFFSGSQRPSWAEEIPPQVTTMDHDVMEKGAVSAIVTSEGKVVQIMANGSCNLSAKRFDSSYEFIAGQMKRRREGPRHVLKGKEKEKVAERCALVPSTGRTAKLRAALVEEELIPPREASAAPTEPPASR